jgi:hypothetical protein
VKTRLGQELLRRVRKDIPCEPVKMGEMTVSRGPSTVEISYVRKTKRLSCPNGWECVGGVGPNGPSRQENKRILGRLKVQPQGRIQIAVTVSYRKHSLYIFCINLLKFGSHCRSWTLRFVRPTSTCNFLESNPIS